MKLVNIFSVNPHLGPLQISLGRMIIDIIKFFFIYTLVLFAFGCGKSSRRFKNKIVHRKKKEKKPRSLFDKYLLFILVLEGVMQNVWSICEVHFLYHEVPLVGHAKAILESKMALAKFKRDRFLEGTSHFQY